MNPVSCNRGQGGFAHAPLIRNGDRVAEVVNPPVYSSSNTDALVVDPDTGRYDAQANSAHPEAIAVTVTSNTGCLSNDGVTVVMVPSTGIVNIPFLADSFSNAPLDFTPDP